MNLSSLKAVLLVEQTRSIAGAAKLLNMDASNVSRIVAGIEHDLGLRIFERTTRRLRITEAGETYLNRIRPLIDELDAAKDDALHTAIEPQGHLRMTSSVAFAVEMIVPLLPAFHTKYPEITVELLPTDANLGLLEQGLDLAVRLAAEPVGDVISTRVLRTRYRVVASPEYIAHHGPITDPSDLAHRNCLRFALPDFRSRWLFRKDISIDPQPVEINGTTLISNALALRDAARGGMGPALLADWLITRDLAAGTLVDVLPGWDCTATEFDTGAFILFPSRNYVPQKTRVMIDFLRENLLAR